jgi:hypothetical protein
MTASVEHPQRKETTVKGLMWNLVAVVNFLAALSSTNGTGWLNTCAGFLALAASFFCRKAS